MSPAFTRDILAIFASKFSGETVNGSTVMSVSCERSCSECFSTSKGCDLLGAEEVSMASRWRGGSRYPDSDPSIEVAVSNKGGR